MLEHYYIQVLIPLYLYIFAEYIVKFIRNIF